MNQKNAPKDSVEILIAEDSPTQTEQLKYLLEKHHFKVVVASNGVQALSLFGQHKPALVISDILMPEMDGYELCRQIKANGDAEDVPVILLTSLSESEDVLEGLSCGADNFITKPYNEDNLISNIQGILANKNLRKVERVRITMEILFKGKKRFVTGDQHQMLTLLISTYEAAVRRNTELAQTQDELKQLNEHLEELVEKRTETLSLEIAERKRTEEGLRQAEENFRRSLDESPLGIRIIGAKGETLYANRAILDIYGFKDIEELNSTPVKKRYAPESYAEYQLRKKKRMNGEGYASEYEISIIRKTGETRRLQVFRKEIIWNRQKQFQAIYQDITERKSAQEKLIETLSGLRTAIGGIIQVLSSITEKRDPYTAGHQLRVADLARAIGQEMGLPADRVEGLQLGAEIHDIGKVSIPAEILSKPTRLTKMEYNLIQLHAQVGHDILGNIDFSWPIAKMILQHHERINGSGYPNQLKGEEILLEARILAVSDVVEAMASFRPYRPALGIEAALEEIEKNKGILYDPDVASACLTLFREKSFEFKP